MSIVKIKRITVAVLTVTLVFAVSRSFSKIVTNVQPDISQEEVRAVVVDDFETEEIKWNVTNEKLEMIAQNVFMVNTVI